MDSPPTSPCSDVTDPYAVEDLEEAVCRVSDGESEMESPLTAWYVSCTPRAGVKRG